MRRAIEVWFSFQPSALAHRVHVEWLRIPIRAARHASSQIVKMFLLVSSSVSSSCPFLTAFLSRPALSFSQLFVLMFYSFWHSKPAIPRQNE